MRTSQGLRWRRALPLVVSVVAAGATIPSLAPAQNAITVPGTLVIDAGGGPQTWYGSVTVTSGPAPGFAIVKGSVTIAAPGPAPVAPPPLACSTWTCDSAGCVSCGGCGDLTVQAVSGPADAVFGQSVTASFTVAYSDTLSSTDALVRLYLQPIVDTSDPDWDPAWMPPNLFVGEVTVAVPPGGAAVGTITGTIPLGEQVPYRYLAVVDPLDAVTEWNEGNNSLLGNSVGVRFVNPDFQVTSVSGPGAVGTGDSVSVTYTVASSSAASASATTAVKVYLSANAGFDAQDFLLGQGTVTVAPGQSVTQTVTATVPPNVGSGTYRFLAVADPDNAVAETDEANNVGAGTSVAVTRWGGMLLYPLANPANFPGMYKLAPVLEGGSMGLAGGTFVTEPFASNASVSGTVRTSIAGYIDWSQGPVFTVAVARRRADGGVEPLCTANMEAVLTGSCAIPGMVRFAVGDRLQVSLGAAYTSYEAMTDPAVAIGSPDTWVEIASPPDLEVVSVEGPTTATSGTDVTVNYTVRSAVTGASSASALVALYLSADDVVDPGDVSLGEGTHLLKPGEAASGSITARLPASVATGSYRYLAVVDPLQVVAEADESNNLTVGNSVSVQLPADLIAETVIGPSATAPGASVALTYRVAASGSSGAALTTATRLYLSLDAVPDPSDTVLGEWSTTLQPGESQTTTQTVVVPTALPAGAYRVLAVVDPEDTVTELNEANNLSVGEPVLVGPDLRLSAFSAPQFGLEGAALDVTDTAWNGGSDAGPFVVAYYLSSDRVFDAGDALLGSRAVTGLVANGSDAGTTSLSLPAGIVGTQYLIAVADAMSGVQEADETNNRSAFSAIQIASLAGGSCSGGATAPVVSSACVTVTTDPVLGVIETPKIAGSSCSDGNPCNGAETCDGNGGCIPGTAPALDDGDACTLDACFPSTGLIHFPIDGCGVVPSQPSAHQIAFTHDAVGNMTAVRDLSTDPSNCGALGHACGSAGGGTASCIDGACWASIGADYYSIDHDPRNCGAIGHACAGAQNGAPTCFAGACGIECLPGFQESNGQCIDITSDPLNCGSAGNACATSAHGTATCSLGTCSLSCEPGYLEYLGQCRDFATSPQRCGAAGTTCQAPLHGVPTCNCGVCGYACEAGFTRSGGECVDLLADPYNCGAVANVCPQAQNGTGVCRAGLCENVTSIPSVTSVNGVSPPGTAFRIGYLGGLTIEGVDLDRVTSVEFEDWGYDVAYPMSNSSWYVHSTPTFQNWVTPTDAGSQAIVFEKTPTRITVNLDAVFATQPWGAFLTGNWYKLRLHYLDGGVDRYVLIDVAWSTWQWDPVTLGAPTITGAAVYVPASVSAYSYDATTGYLTVYPGGLASQATLGYPTSVANADFTVEYPVFEVVSETGGAVILRIPRNLEPATFCYDGGEWYGTNLVYELTGAVEQVVNVDTMRLVLRGSNLGSQIWNPSAGSSIEGEPDGPLLLSDVAGNVLPGRVWGAALPSAILLRMGAIADISAPSAYLEFRSERGTARTPWPMSMVAYPRVSMVRTLSQDPLACTGICPEAVPYNEVVEVTGAWFDRVLGLTFGGPTAATEPLTRLADPAAVPGPGQFVVVDANHLKLRLPGDGAVPRELVAFYEGQKYMGAEHHPGWRAMSLTTDYGSAYGWTWNAVSDETPGLKGVTTFGSNGYDPFWFSTSARVDETENESAAFQVVGFDPRSDVASVTLLPLGTTARVPVSRGKGGYTATGPDSLVIGTAALAMARWSYPMSFPEKYVSLGLEVTLSNGAVLTSGAWIEFYPKNPPVFVPSQGTEVHVEFVPLPAPWPLEGGNCSNTMCGP